MTIRTFSGAHPYRPQCVVAAARDVFTEALESIAPGLHSLASECAVAVAERITSAIGENICPRCSDPLVPTPVPNGWRAAGSRATRCRCIPVCETCASWIEPILGASPPTVWPTDLDIDEDGGSSRKQREAEFAERAKAKCKPARVRGHGPDGPVVATDDAVIQVQLRPNPGGWLEFGYDGTADQAERQS